MNKSFLYSPSTLLDDFSLCAANAFVCSNISSWNCFESVVVVDKSTDLRLLKKKKKRSRNMRINTCASNQVK